MHLISVLLPEPDGPQTTTTSRGSTVRLQPRSTLFWPNDFETPRSSIMALMTRTARRWYSNRPPSEIAEQITRYDAAMAIRIVIGANSRALTSMALPVNSLHADHRGDRGEFEQPDILVEQDRDDACAALCGTTISRSTWIGRKPGRKAGVDDALRHRAQAGADVFGQIGADEQNKSADRGPIGGGLVAEQGGQSRNSR